MNESLGLCVAECDTLMCSSFLCLRITDIKEGIIYKKEPVRNVPDFVIRTMLLGCSTQEGKRQWMEGNG